jgi:hypothetical protein
VVRDSPPHHHQLSEPKRQQAGEAKENIMKAASNDSDFFTSTQNLMSSNIIIHPVDYVDNAAALLSIAGSILRIAKQIGDEKYGLLVSARVHANRLSLDFGPVGMFDITLELDVLTGVAERLRNLSSSKRFIYAVCAE